MHGYQPISWLLVTLASVLLGLSCGGTTRDAAVVPMATVPGDPSIASFLSFPVPINLQQVSELHPVTGGPAIRDYLTWLAQRPGTEPYEVRADHHGPTVTIQIGHSRGTAFATVAACELDTPLRPPSPGMRGDCPQLWALWQDQAPAAVATVQEAVPFVPYWLTLPAPPPDGYSLQALRFPSSLAAAIVRPFVISAVFTAPTGAAATLLQQPWGGLSFPEDQDCRPVASPFAAPTAQPSSIAGEEVWVRTWETPGRYHACAAWSGGPGSTFVLLVEETQATNRVEVIRQVIERLMHTP